MRLAVGTARSPRDSGPPGPAVQGRYPRYAAGFVCVARLECARAVLLRHVVENTKYAHPKFPNRQFVLKRWCQINQAFPSSGRYAGLISEQLANVGENAVILDRTTRKLDMLGFGDCISSDEYLVGKRRCPKTPETNSPREWSEQAESGRL